MFNPKPTTIHDENGALENKKYGIGMTLMAIALLKMSGMKRHTVNINDKLFSHVGASLEMDGDDYILRLHDMNVEEIETMIEQDGEEKAVSKMVEKINKALKGEASSFGTTVQTDEQALGNPHYAQAVTMLLFDLMAKHGISKHSVSRKKVDAYIDGPLGIHIEDDSKDGLTASFVSQNEGKPN